MVFTTCVVCLAPALICQWQLASITAVEAANRRATEGAIVDSGSAPVAGNTTASDASHVASQSIPLTAVEAPAGSATVNVANPVPAQSA